MAMRYNEVVTSFLLVSPLRSVLAKISLADDEEAEERG
jgi:hypothetical protein